MALEDKYNIKLYPCTNGWIVAVVSGRDENAEGEVNETFYVYEMQGDIDDDKKRLNECRVMRDLLYSIMDGLFFYNSKHSAYNIRINVVDRVEEVVKL